MEYENERTMQEVTVLQEMKHPNIITPLETCRDGNYLYLVQEFGEGGTLFERIIKNKHISEEVAKNYVKQILQGLCYCH